MNIMIDRHLEAQKDLTLLESALEALEKNTEIKGLILETGKMMRPGFRADAIIELRIAGDVRQYIAEVKRVDRLQTIGRLHALFATLPLPGLLVAPRITLGTARKCRELDIQFIDAHGNAYLRGQGWYVLVTGQQTKEGDAAAAPDAPRGGTATALRVIFAMLCHPELINAPYREITTAAGVALGAIGGVFNDLETRGHATGGGGLGGRRLLERKRLIDEWVTNYPIKLRPKLNPRRFHAPEPDWWRGLDITRYGAQWGGEVAADKLTQYLKPKAITIYMRPVDARENLMNLVAKNKLRAAQDGEVEILQAFWDFPPDEALPDTVPPLLVYADLMATMDPRNFEAARLIYEQKINAPQNLA